MRTLLALGLTISATGLTSADDKKDLTVGKWVIESVTRDGKAVDALKGAPREHADGTYTLRPANDTTALHHRYLHHRRHQDAHDDRYEGQGRHVRRQDPPRHCEG